MMVWQRYVRSSPLIKGKYARCTGCLKPAQKDAIHMYVWDKWADKEHKSQCFYRCFSFLLDADFKTSFSHTGTGTAHFLASGLALKDHYHHNSLSNSSLLLLLNFLSLLSKYFPGNKEYIFMPVWPSHRLFIQNLFLHSACRWPSLLVWPS